MTKAMFPGQDPYLWDSRYSAIKELVKDLVKTVHQRGMCQPINPCCIRFVGRKLQRQNQKLKSAQPAPSGSSKPRLGSPHPKDPGHPKVWPPPRMLPHPKVSMPW